MAPKKRRRYNKRPRFAAENHTPLLSEETIERINEEIDTMFNKKYTLKTKQNSWELPDPALMYTSEIETIDELMEMKGKLNETKSLLNDIDIVQWHQHTRRMHKAGFVVKRLREDMHAEMCTQAFAKLHEILATYNLLPQDAVDAGHVFTLHLCEAPGAFISATNHYLKANYPGIRWEWLATTLNPYYEGHSLKALLDDDRFIVETFDNWDFGVDGTGDLMSVQNLQGLQQACKAKGTVHLITADGSIDCADEPAEQESAVCQLIFCETVTALRVLSKGGCYVFKMFTALEHAMICLMYLLACLFDEVHIIKPATSKAGNSEVYVACCGFTGSVPREYQDILTSVYQPCSPDKAMFPLDSIPREFLDGIKECEKYFIDMQIQEINLNINHFYHMSSLEKKELFHLRNEASNHYIEKYRVSEMEDEGRIVIGTHLDGTQMSFTRGPSNIVPIQEAFSGRSKTGSYNERQELEHKGWLEMILEDNMFSSHQVFPSSLQGLSCSSNGAKLIPTQPSEVDWLNMPITPPQYSEWNDILQITRGRAIDKVRNSRFCSPSYITRLNEAKENAAIMDPRNVECLRSIVKDTSPGSFQVQENMLNIFQGETEFRREHSCNICSIIAVDKLVAFTDLKQESSNVEVSQRSHQCGCLVRYIRARNMNVNISSRDKHSCQPEQENIEKTQGQTQSYFEHDHSSRNASTHDSDLENNSECCFDEFPRKKDLYLGFLISDASTDPTESLQTPLELLSKGNLLQECIHALKGLRRGGTFVCQIFDCLSRFTVGLIYILHRVFSHIAIVKPVVGNLWHPERFLVCKGYQGCSSEVIVHLEKVLSRSRHVNQCHIVVASANQIAPFGDRVSDIGNEGEKPELDILEVVPVCSLYENRFYQFIKNSNEQLCYIQLHNIVRLEMCHKLPDSSLPSEEEREQLVDEVAAFLDFPSK